MEEIAFTTTDMGGVLHVTNLALYGTGLSICEVQATFERFRVNYLNNGVMIGLNIPFSVAVKRLYRVQADVQVGNGDGYISLSVDGVEIWRISGLFNNAPASTINAVEYGDDWGPANTTQYIYSAAFYSSTVIPPVTYTLTIASALDGSTSPVAGSYQYPSGTTVQVTATPSQGHVFDHWIANGVSYTQNPIPLVMTANISLTPVFALAPPVQHRLTVGSMPTGVTFTLKKI